MMRSIALLACFSAVTDAQQTRTLTAAELATVSCTVMNGEVTFDTSDSAKWNFYDIPEVATPGATWVCDITSTDDFTAVSASYTIRGNDPITGAVQDPDDNEAMTAWGNDPAGHNGYFSFGTPGTVVNPGGTMGGNVAHGTTQSVTWAEGTVAETNIVRFGFDQSANHEDFSIENVAVTITATSSVADEESGACSAKCCKGTWSGTDCTTDVDGLILVQHVRSLPPPLLRGREPQPPLQVPVREQRRRLVLSSNPDGNGTNQTVKFNSKAACGLGLIRLKRDIVSQHAQKAALLKSHLFVASQPLP